MILRWLCLGVHSFTVGVCFMLLGCQQKTTDRKFSTDQKAILEIYASKYLSQQNHQLYIKSEKKNTILNILSPPLTYEDFELYKLAPESLGLGNNADSLFSKQELNSWRRQISAYRQFNWDRTMFPDYVTFIREKQIPDYRKRTSIAPPGQEPIHIHYIIPPLIYDGKSAFLYSSTSKGAGSNRTHYLYFVKTGEDWYLKDKGVLVTIY